MKVLLALLISFNSSAGVLKDFCRRYLVDDNPYQYETLSTQAVYRQYLSEGVECFWKQKSSRNLYVLGNELRQRASLEPDMVEALEAYSRFEDK
jgi:hypothetical protein